NMNPGSHIKSQKDISKCTFSALIYFSGITNELYENQLENDKFYPLLPDGGSSENLLPILKPWENDFRFPSGNDRILKLIRNDNSDDDLTADNIETPVFIDSVSEMAAALQARPHLHWAFSVAWSKHHADYPGASKGKFAPAREIAEAFLNDLDNYDACSLADVAHAALVEREGKQRAVAPLENAEPAKDANSRHRAASDLVDLVLRNLSRRKQRGEFGQKATGENHNVTLRAKEESAAEFCSADLDERAPVFLPLKRPSAILRSAYQVPRAPPGGIDLDGSLSAEKVGSDLAEMLIPEHGTFEVGKPNTRLWNALNDELWHLCKKETGPDRGRYFVVFSGSDSLEAHNGQLLILKDKLKWLRYFVLDTEGLDRNDSFRPLGDILFRHQRTS
ncbi:MAG: hypothetical protein JXR76_09235, partial [Deltaproteobacteria bacterium]|nr:hypothetical protein [Deltaproteobacteria bacterium]